jgi:hypothetical protein
VIVYPTIFASTAKLDSIMLNNIDNPSGIVHADIDGDDDIDVVISANGFVRWYENQNGFFGDDHLVYECAYDSTITAAAVGDYDNDDDIDIVVSCAKEIYVAINNSKGKFKEPITLETATDVDGYYSDFKEINTLAFADIDQDGNQDIVVGGKPGYSQYSNPTVNPSSVGWYQNKGDNTFSEVNSLDDSGEVSSIDVVDLDSDGDIDILVANASENYIAWYENLGNGTIGVKQEITSNTNGASSVTAVDLDNDGDLDVASASENDNKIAWYENLGEQSFSSQLILSTNVIKAKSIAAVDS